MPKPAINTLEPGFIVLFSMALFRAIGTLDDDVLPIFSISNDLTHSQIEAIPA